MIAMYSLFISGAEIFFIMFIVVMVFGADKIPEIARGMGKGIREFKRASSDIRYELERADEQEDPPQPQPRSGSASREKSAEASVESEVKNERRRNQNPL